MPNSYTFLRYHVTFSTKDRFPWISQDWNTDLCSYIGGIVRGQKGKLIEIGGQPDHLHLLFSMWPDQALSEMRYCQRIVLKIKKRVSGHRVSAPRRYKPRARSA
jgi:REP element-mobilizing transposase RayT